MAYRYEESIYNGVSIRHQNDAYGNIHYVFWAPGKMATTDLEEAHDIIDNYRARTPVKVFTGKDLKAWMLAGQATARVTGKASSILNVKQASTPIVKPLAFFGPFDPNEVEENPYIMPDPFDPENVGKGPPALDPPINGGNGNGNGAGGSPLIGGGSFSKLNNSLWNFPNFNENALMWLLMLKLSSTKQGLQILGQVLNRMSTGLMSALNGYAKSGSANRISAWGAGRMLSLVYERFGIITQDQAIDYNVGLSLMAGAEYAEDFLSLIPFAGLGKSDDSYPDSITMAGDTYHYQETRPIYEKDEKDK